VLVVVVLVLPPAAALGRIDALVLAAAPPLAAALGAAEAPALLPAAPTALVDGLVVVVVVDVPPVDATPRMSMNTTVSPLVAMFMNVPAMGMLAAEEDPVVEPEVLAVELPEVDVELDPEAPLALPEVKVPFHWFCVSSCW